MGRTWEGAKAYVSLELCELEASTVEFENVDQLGGVRERVAGGGSLDVGRVLAAAVLALPDKVCLAAAAAHVVLLEAADRDGVGVRLAARGALDLEGVVEGRIFGVEGAQVGDTAELGLEGESKHHGVWGKMWRMQVMVMVVLQEQRRAPPPPPIGAAAAVSPADFLADPMRLRLRL
jgi:hypothetical protein